MGTIEAWREAGVDLRVYVNTVPGIVYGGLRSSVPFNPGGPDGVPLGFTSYSLNPGIDNKTQISRFVEEQGTNDWFYIQSATVPNNSSYWGGTYETDAVANRRYFVTVDVRKIDLYSGYYRTWITEYNPSTGNETYLAAVDNYATDSWVTIALISSRPLRVAQGWTKLRIRLTGQNPGNATTDSFGIRFRNLEIIARNEAATSPVWRDITCDVQELTTRYGRERFTNRYEVATANLQLLNIDGEYSYKNPHPFNFGPGRQIKVEATYAGVTYPFAYGVIDGLVDTVDLDGHAVTAVNCLDPSTVMANKSVPGLPWVNPPFPSGQRIATLVDYIGYPYKLLDAGQWTEQAIQASGRSVRDEIGISSDSEGGSVFADRSGNFVYKDRSWLTTDAKLKNVTANFDARQSNQLPFDGTPTLPGAPRMLPNRLVTDYSQSRIVNYVELASAGTSARTYRDLDSDRDYGPKTYQRMDFVLLASTAAQYEAWIDQRAADIMDGYDQPKLRLNALVYRADLIGNDWTWTLTAFLNWLVRVWYQNPRTGWGWLIVTHIQSIEHRITPTEWETTLSLDQPTYYSDAPITDYGYWDTGAKWDTSYVWS